MAHAVLEIFERFFFFRLICSLKLSHDIPKIFPFQNSVQNYKTDGQGNIDDLIDLKCRNLGKTVTSRGGAFHLAQWMKGLGEDNAPLPEVPEANGDLEVKSL